MIISSEAIKQAANFINYLEGLGEIKKYSIFHSDNEINFYWSKWRNEDIIEFVLDLGFKGDGIYSYYCKLPNGKEFEEDAVKFDMPLPNEIIEYLKV